MTTYAPVQRRGFTRVPIDPRIRDRRVAVKREEGHRRLHRLIAILSLVAATVAAGAALFSPLLDVDTVAVTGSADPSRAREVREAAAVGIGDPTLLVDTGEVEERVKALSWVERASASRELPGTVRITVVPRVGVGWAPRADGKVSVVDARSVAIDIVDAPPAGLPQLAAAAAERPGHVAPKLAARVAAALPTDVRAAAGAVTVVEGDAVVALTGGPELRLGDGHALAAKVRAATAVLQARAGVPTYYIDVRVPSAPASG